MVSSMEDICECLTESNDPACDTDVNDKNDIDIIEVSTRLTRMIDMRYVFQQRLYLRKIEFVCSIKAVTIMVSVMLQHERDRMVVGQQ